MTDTGRLYFNLVQTLLWISYRDSALAGKFASGEIDCNRISLAYVYLANSQSIDDLVQDIQKLLIRLEGGDLAALGCKNNRGNPRAIPQEFWSGAEIPVGALRPYAKQLHPREGSSEWYDLRFKVSEVKKLWPAKVKKEFSLKSKYKAHLELYRAYHEEQKKYFLKDKIIWPSMAWDKEEKIIKPRMEKSGHVYNRGHFKEARKEVLAYLKRFGATTKSKANREKLKMLLLKEKF